MISVQPGKVAAIQASASVHSSKMNGDRAAYDDTIWSQVGQISETHPAVGDGYESRRWTFEALEDTAGWGSILPMTI